MLEEIEAINETAKEFSPLTQDWTTDYSYKLSEFCDITEFEDRTSWAVENFITRDCTRDVPYEYASLDLREGYMQDFHDNFSEFSGYSDNLNFRTDMGYNELGAFNPETKQIDLNARLLADADPREVMTTIMHESRHAFQDFAINHPEQVTVSPQTIEEWKHNFDHYISPEFDFEAYVSQPVEADANAFAERMYNEGLSNA